MVEFLRSLAAIIKCSALLPKNTMPCEDSALAYGTQISPLLPRGRPFAIVRPLVLGFTVVNNQQTYNPKKIDETENSARGYIYRSYYLFSIIKVEKWKEPVWTTADNRADGQKHAITANHMSVFWCMHRCVHAHELMWYGGWIKLLTLTLYRSVFQRDMTINGTLPLFDSGSGVEGTRMICWGIWRYCYWTDWTTGNDKGNLSDRDNKGKGKKGRP